MNKKQANENVKRLFLTSASVYCILLLLLSFLAVYFSCHDKKSRILSSMEMVCTYTGQEFDNVVNNFWQAYMPVYETREEDSLLFQEYYISDEELSPQERQQLSSLLQKMSLRDNRIAWIALYSPSRTTNLIQYATASTVSPLPEDFPWLDKLMHKEQQMEIFGSANSIFSADPFSPSTITFAICGGVPFGIKNGSILIGYQTASLAASTDMLHERTPSMEYYVISSDQVLYHSNGNYDPSSLFLPDRETSGIIDVSGQKKYVLAVPSGNAQSFVVCTVGYSDMQRAVHRDTPLLLAIFIAFFGFSIFIGHSIQKRVSREVAVIRNGLNILADNHLDYQLPTDFTQSGLPEIAQDINLMSSRLNESIKKAYYFELKQKEAEIAELQATFNPHFLYNTLEMLRNKCYSNGDVETSELIASLASIFRSFIGAKTFVTFQEELAFSRKYLSLLVARYGDLVRFRYDIDSGLLQYGIIRNVFQLLIENYFVHGFDPGRDDNEIVFSGTFSDDGDILIRVTDNGYGMSDDELNALNAQIEQPIRHNAKHFGLKNLNQRLKLFYGPAYGLHIERNEPSGLSVSIRIRRMTVEDYEKDREKLYTS